MKTTLLLLLLTLSAGAQGRLEETLRKGILEEESKQNLTAAIQAYQSVLTQFESDRKTAATALFRMAESYLKLGRNNEATAAYSRLAHEFPDQTKLIEQGRNHLVNTLKLKPERTAGTLGKFLDKDLVRDPEEAEARNRYRALLEEQIKLVEEQLAGVQKQYQLGAANSQGVLNVRAEILKHKRELAAFDAGIAVPKR